MNRVFLAAAVLAVAGMPSFAQPTEVWSHGDPTNDEQYMLELVNRARANPTAEGIRLMDTDDQGVQAAYTYFQIDAVATKQAFTTYPERPPLAFHPALITAARAHTADMVEHNFQGHTSTNGDGLQQRYAAVSYQSIGQYGENVSAYSNSVWYGHCGLNVDWGQQNQIDLGHRSNIMNFDQAVYTEIGIGITKTNGGLQSGTVGPYVITQDFGMRQPRYILGVVYNDQNANGFYDPGEGMAGVEVRPATGSYYAVTSSSGGYAIPYAGTGSVVVTASGGALAGTMTRTVIMNGDNVKVDFVPTAQAPAAVALAIPTNDATGVTLPVQLTWTAIDGAGDYQVQIGTTMALTGSTVQEFTVTEPSLGDVDAACGTRLYWRVRARNEAGFGPWSPTWSFTTHMITSIVSELLEPRGTVYVPADLVYMPFRWEPATDADRYHLQIRNGNGDIVYDDSTETTTESNQWRGWVTTPNVAYTWRVRAHNSCGWQPWTESETFRAIITGVSETDAATGLSLVVGPNPGSVDSWLTVRSDAGGRADLRVVDAAGRLVTAAALDLGDGGRQLRLSSLSGLAGLPAGHYVISVSDGRRTAATSLVIVR